MLLAETGILGRESEASIPYVAARELLAAAQTGALLRSHQLLCQFKYFFHASHPMISIASNLRAYLKFFTNLLLRPSSTVAFAFEVSRLGPVRAGYCPKKGSIHAFFMRGCGTVGAVPHRPIRSQAAAMHSTVEEAHIIFQNSTTYRNCFYLLQQT